MSWRLISFNPLKMFIYTRMHFAELLVFGREHKETKNDLHFTAGCLWARLSREKKSVQRRPLPNVISMRLQKPIGFRGLGQDFCRFKCLCAYIWEHLGCVASVPCQIAVAKAFLVYLGCSWSGQTKRQKFLERVPSDVRSNKLEAGGG